MKSLLTSSTRGRLLRAAQNQRAYKKKHPEHCYKRPPPLPLPLVALATQPLPNSYHFREVKASAESFEGSDYDDSILVQWISIPFPHDLPGNDLTLTDFSDALHGFQCRLQYNDERMRLQHYQEGIGATFINDEYIILAGLLNEWFDIKIVVKGMKGTHKVIGTHLLQWKARCIAARHQYYVALVNSSNVDKYISVYLDRWSQP